MSFGLRKGARIPSMAEEVATETSSARRASTGSRRYGLAWARVGLKVASFYQPGARAPSRPTAAINAPSSRVPTPSAKSDLIVRSSDTEVSAASIFATRDWLDPIFRASSTCVIPTFARRSLSAFASARWSSTNASSAASRPRNSATVPKRQQAASSRLCFVTFIGQVLAMTRYSMSNATWNGRAAGHREGSVR